MIGLTTDRLVFRKWELSDLDDIAGFFEKEENARFVGGVKDREGTWRIMATYIGHYELMGFSYLAMEEKDSGQLVGTVGLWFSDGWPEHELGYWLLPQAQGQGFGAEAGLAVRNYALETLNFPSLVSYIDPANKPSQKLAEKIGGKYEKMIDLLDYGPHMIYRHK